MSGMRLTRWWKAVILAGVVFLCAIQLVPYGRDHDNPAVIREPAWDSAETRALAHRACFDCHSNETVWPAYAQVAPASWLIYHDVTEGRLFLNVSEWQRPQEEAAESAEVVRLLEMPPFSYRMMHPGARLTAAEREQLARGLEKTMGAGGGEESRR